MLVQHVAVCCLYRNSSSNINRLREPSQMACQKNSHHNFTLSYTEKILDGRPVISYNKDEKMRRCADKRSAPIRHLQNSCQ